MGIIIRQSIQNSIISYIGVVLGFISTMLLFPNILTADQYGLTRLLISLSLICAQFAHLGIKGITIRYFPYFRHSPKKRGSFLTLTILIPLAGFALFIAVYLTLSDLFLASFDDKSDLFAGFYIYLIPLVFSALFFETLNSYIQALFDSVTGSFLNEVLMRVLIIGLLIAFYFELLSFTGFMVLFILIYCIRPFYLLLYLYQKKELLFFNPFQNLNQHYFKEMAVFGVYTFLGGIASLLIGNIDIIMLGAILPDLSSTAIYAIAFYAGSVISIPQRSINKIAQPILAELMKNENYEEVDSLYSRTSLNQIIAGSLLFVGIWANIHNLMYLLPPEYDEAQWVIIIIGAAQLFNMATSMNGGIISNSPHFRFGFYMNILLVLLTVITNYLLIPIYGIIGAAVATAFSIFLYNFIKFIFVWVKFSMQPFQWNALAVLIIAASCLLLSFQIPYLYNFFLDVTIRSLFITILFIGAILLFNLSEDVKNLATESLRRLKEFSSH